MGLDVVSLAVVGLEVVGLAVVGLDVVVGLMLSNCRYLGLTLWGSM